ncbi:MAG: 50S ribosomal protein L3 [Anaerolineae bacterium]
MKAILGHKVGMTQVFDDTGGRVPITVVEAGPCYVTQIKTEERDGYSAVQFGFGEAKRLNKPEKGHLGDLPQVRHLREFRLENEETFEVGQVIDAGTFAPGDVVDVTGVSKGKGTAGVMKRHGFGGGRRTHGQSDRERAPGSIGGTTTPGKVFKGLKMAGRMGNRRVTVPNLEVVLADGSRNLLGLKGAVPGSKGTLLKIREAVKGGGA